jgi:hypothetical protein
MKPAIVDTRRVEGWMRSSQPLGRVKSSIAAILAPACARTRRSRDHSTAERFVMSTIAPPLSGTPWPKLHVPAPRIMSGMRERAAARAIVSTSALSRGVTIRSANLFAISRRMIGLVDDDMSRLRRCTIEVSVIAGMSPMSARNPATSLS